MATKPKKTTKQGDNLLVNASFDDVIGVTVSNIGKQNANKVITTNTPSIPKSKAAKKK